MLSPISGWRRMSSHSSSSSGSGLGQDRLGDADLADVVEQRAVGDHLGLFVLDSETRGETSRQHRQALAVMLGHRILGLDGVGQGRHHGMGGFHAHEGRAQPEGASNAGEELGLAERLGEIVIGAGFEAGHDVVELDPGGEHDDRQGRVGGIAPEARQTSMPSIPGQADVQDHEFRTVGGDGASAPHR